MSHPIEVVVRERFGGRLLPGKHPADGEACALEAASAARGGPWTDDPASVGLPDLRRINDAYLDDAARTRALVPVMVALWDWPSWSEERRMAWAGRVAVRTVREILPVALEAVGLEAEAARCRAAETASGASDAAYAASDAAAYAASAYAAAYAAAYASASAASDAAAAYASASAAYASASAASDAASADARHTVLDAACRIWTEEASA